MTSPTQSFETPSRSSGQVTLDGSPTSTFTASSGILDQTRSYRSLFAATTAAPKRHVLIRADASLISCFDPSDKELWDLWAPKR